MFFLFQCARGKKVWRYWRRRRCCRRRSTPALTPRSPDWFLRTYSAVPFRLFLRYQFRAFFGGGKFISRIIIFYESVHKIDIILCITISFSSRQIIHCFFGKTFWISGDKGYLHEYKSYICLKNDIFITKKGKKTQKNRSNRNN